MLVSSLRLKASSRPFFFPGHTAKCVLGFNPGWLVLEPLPTSPVHFSLLPEQAEQACHSGCPHAPRTLGRDSGVVVTPPYSLTSKPACFLFGVQV